MLSSCATSDRLPDGGCAKHPIEVDTRASQPSGQPLLRDTRGRRLRGRQSITVIDGLTPDSRRRPMECASSGSLEAFGVARLPALISMACLISVIFSACDENVDRTGVTIPEDSLGQYVNWGDDVVLEENDDVVNVRIRMNLDPLGGFLVADESESQGRRYDAEGSLLSHFGRRGGGPGEFNSLHRVLRLPTGEIIAFDARFRATVFDRTGSDVIRSFRYPVGRLHHASLINDTLLLLGGKAQEGDDAQEPADSDWLHFWNLARDSLTRSFFQPPIDRPAKRLAANSAGFIGADRRGDSIAAVFSLSDTVYVFSLDGRLRRKTPISSEHFRRFTEDVGMPRSGNGVQSAMEWIGSFSLMSNLFWLEDGSFLIQYQDRRGPAPEWRLLLMQANGSVVFEVIDTPRLLNVDDETNTLYFIDPRSEVPNTWLRAVLDR